MTLRTGEDTCGGIVLEEALDLSFDRLLMMMMIFSKLCSIHFTTKNIAHSCTVFVFHYLERNHHLSFNTRKNYVCMCRAVVKN